MDGLLLQVTHLGTATPQAAMSDTDVGGKPGEAGARPAGGLSFNAFISGSNHRRPGAQLKKTRVINSGMSQTFRKFIALRLGVNLPIQ